MKPQTIRNNDDLWGLVHSRDLAPLGVCSCATEAPAGIVRETEPEAFADGFPEPKKGKTPGSGRGQSFQLTEARGTSPCNPKHTREG